MIKNKIFKKKGHKDKSAQLKNKEWWQENPMNYNWNEEKKKHKFNFFKRYKRY